jgi:hypothetical protein
LKGLVDGEGDVGKVEVAKSVVVVLESERVLL